MLTKLGDELRFAFITSDARLHELHEASGSATDVEGLRVRVQKSAHGKCVRCWHLRPDVGSHAAHPELCGRCIENVDGRGEVRRHV